MFHSFLPWRPALAEALDRRCRHLQRFYHPISLTEAAHAWKNGERLPPNALAITVDDGYRDFHELAYPIFAARRLPVTVYLVTEFMDGTLWLWPDQLRYLVENSGSRSLETSLPSGERIALKLETAAGREHALAVLSEAAKRMPDAQKRRLLDELPAMLDVHLPTEPPAEYAPLTWQCVKQMSSDGIEFGAHTRTHPILSRVESETALRDEIEGSKRRIEAEIGRPVRHFCYPNGKPEDIDMRTVESVQRAGFETAVVTEEGFNFAGADPFRLKRIPADPAYADSFFEEYVAGVHAR